MLLFVDVDVFVFAEFCDTRFCGDCLPGMTAVDVGGCCPLCLDMSTVVQG